MTKSRFLVFAMALAVCSSALLADDDDHDDNHNPRAQRQESDGPRISPHGMNRIGKAPTAGGTAALSPIVFHGGPVMGTPTAYLIWYGNWNQTNGSDTSSGQELTRDFLFGLNNSQYMQVDTTYGGPTGGVRLGGEATVTARRGASLSDNGVLTVVRNVLNAGTLPLDRNGIYFVVTSSDIAKSGFCSSFCGWHTHATINGTDVKYSFVGNSNRCLNSCAAQTTGPNGNAGVDGMLSVLAHEFQEAETDPDLNAWFDNNGAENADKCAWTFGQSQGQAGNGAFFNLTLPSQTQGTRNYLIQRNLSATDNKCYINFVTRAQ